MSEKVNGTLVQIKPSTSMTYQATEHAYITFLPPTHPLCSVFLHWVGRGFLSLACLLSSSNSSCQNKTAVDLK